MLLAVEARSPGSARTDRHAKRLSYQRLGLPEYLNVDLDARVVERWRPTDERPAMFIEELRWQPDGAEDPLVTNLPAYFDRAWGSY
jgi:Uma2 family endonuclease